MLELEKKVLWPRNLTLLLTVPFLPVTKAMVLPYSVAGLVLCLLIHEFWPGRAEVPLTLRQKGVMLVNVIMTYTCCWLEIEGAGDNIYAVSSWREVPWLRELVLFAFWTACNEVLFFHGHRFLHRPGLYERCHKWHHHFKITSAWTSYYSHPLDHLFLHVCGMGVPVWMLWHGTQMSAPGLAIWLHVPTVVFTASHHSVVVDLPGRGDKRVPAAIGSKHLLHHQQFNVNYGNFTLFDQLSGTLRSVPASWLAAVSVWDVF